ncbi:MAG: ATP-binding cassette domain-containing protein [Blastocatellales bacterium]
MSLLIESEIIPDSAAITAGKRDDTEVVIRLENVTVEYRVPREQIRSFKEYAIRLLQGRVKHEEFKALSDVSLEIRQGEVMGVIGHNGAGKSTLLKLVSRVMKPTRGRVWVKGRIAPLLELGAGFHPELSGRENVFLNGTLIGYTQAEIESLFDEIVDFAELRDFIEAPLRTYSTGMAVRLGFAVATATQPDILIVDEVLSVGDEQFRQKCAARMDGFRESGTTILLVTHDSKQVVSICDRAAWLDHGHLRAVGDAQTIVNQYQEAYAAVIPKPIQARGTETDSASSAENQLSLDERINQKKWFYRFNPPGGKHVACHLPDEAMRLHDDRLAMIHSVLGPIYGQDWRGVSCLDLGCHQGFFAVKMAESGCRKVLGVDIDEEKIKDASLIRRLYGLSNLSFSHADMRRLSPEETGKFDVTLMLDMFSSFENPINAIRVAKALTKRLLIIETPAPPEASGQIDPAVFGSRKTLHGSIALIDRVEESNPPASGSAAVPLYPGREALIWLMRRLGFSRVEVVTPPVDVCEQLTSGKRIMVVGHV